MANLPSLIVHLCLASVRMSETTDLCNCQLPTSLIDDRFLIELGHRIGQILAFFFKISKFSELKFIQRCVLFGANLNPNLTALASIATIPLCLDHKTFYQTCRVGGVGLAFPGSQANSLYVETEGRFYSVSFPLNLCGCFI